MTGNVTLTIFTILLIGCICSNQLLHSQFPFVSLNQSKLRFNRMILDVRTKYLYVGAVNWIIQLDENLKVLNRIQTGPLNDSHSCYASGCDSIRAVAVPAAASATSDAGAKKTASTSLMDNYNKILLIDYEKNRLIGCGSLRQGACTKYNLDNITLNPEFYPIAIAANDPNASTFAFIGPQRYNNWDTSSVIYVGTTFTANGEYRHDVPAISTRNLNNLMYAEDYLKQPILQVEVIYRDHFLVSYVYGFNISEYAYFLIIQKQSHLPGQEEQGYVTRLARICTNDQNYDSYIEVTLECAMPPSSQTRPANASSTSATKNNTKFNLAQDAKLFTNANENIRNVLMGASSSSYAATSSAASASNSFLVVTFRPAHGVSNEPTNRSAVCAYSMDEIETKFNENIHYCFNGSVPFRNMEYISGQVNQGRCANNNNPFGNIVNFCEAGLKINGNLPISKEAILTYDNFAASSLFLTSTSNNLVMLLGSTNGVVKKILMAHPDPIEYDQFTVDAGSAILPDSFVSDDNQYAYIISTSKISKIRMENCSRFNSCADCLNSMDPYCGWCSLEKKCTVRNVCQKASHSSPRWLSLSGNQQCIEFERIQPDRIPIGEDSLANVKLYVRTLPELPYGAKYKCVFGANVTSAASVTTATGAVAGISGNAIAPTIDATVTEFGLTCPIPKPSERPKIRAGHDHILISLAIRSSETQKDFVSRTFAYYDCSKHSTCFDCTRSKWACNWCVYENKCVHNYRKICQQPVISSENNPNMLASHGRKSCPRFRRVTNAAAAADDASDPATADTSSSPALYLIPNEVPKELKFELENLPFPFPGQSSFKCIVSIEGAKMLIPARIEYNNNQYSYVICDKTTYSYKENVAEYEANVEVVWNQNNHIDDMNITLYKCDVLGTDCSLCITRDPKYNCVWCEQKCVFNETCQPSAAAGVAAGATAAAVPNHRCPRPRIDRFWPTSGPIEGGVLLTIEGSNLGFEKQKVFQKIHVGKVPCRLVGYDVSVRIRCVTGAVDSEIELPVIVGNEAGYTESTVLFSYRKIQVYTNFPKRGPMSGGTQLAITGRNLDIGHETAVYLDDYECKVNKTQTTSKRLICVTARVSRPRTIKQIILRIGDSRQAITGLPFMYTADPKIMEIKPLRSFVSGGRSIVVHGLNFDSVQQPKMGVYDPSSLRELNRTKCRVLDENQIECPSPPVNSFWFVSAAATGTSDTQPQSKSFSLPLDSEAADSSYLFSSRIARDAPIASVPTTASKRRRKRKKRQRQWHRKKRNNGRDSFAAMGPHSSLMAGGSDFEPKPRSQQYRYNYIELQIFFIMDAVESVRDLNQYFPNVRSQLVYVPDPVYLPFANFLKFYKGDTLVLEGDKLNAASDDTDVIVTIGSKICNITSLTASQLVCVPPEKQPQNIYDFAVLSSSSSSANDDFDGSTAAGSDTDGSTSGGGSSNENTFVVQHHLNDEAFRSLTDRNLPLVVIHVGKTLKFTVGYLQYELLRPFNVRTELIAVVAVGFLLSVLFFVTILLVYRKKSNLAEREYKRIQIQMDTLESNVRLECKQAFAELQTDMTDLAADLEISGIPILDYAQYIIKVFFPGVINHPVLVVNETSDNCCCLTNGGAMSALGANTAIVTSSSSLSCCYETAGPAIGIGSGGGGGGGSVNVGRSNYDTAMLQFEKLLFNKQFLLKFIETLESQQSFNIRDKVNVASLLMVVLMPKMDYATEILRCLLMKLIEKSIGTKHPQLMLRRTESVVEKMLTNWMAICMYENLKRSTTGSSLFFLFKALKHQIEKGAVDAITYDARYSLADERLLREQVDYSVVTLHIIQDDMDEKIQCKVLDCDTISQVKAKILDVLFKNTPYSQRPQIDELNLEWRHGRAGHLTLQDFDLTTRVVNGGWTRLNTLMHYGIKESALMSLVFKNPGPSPYGIGLDDDCHVMGGNGNMDDDDDDNNDNDPHHHHHQHYSHDDNEQNEHRMKHQISGNAACFKCRPHHSFIGAGVLATSTVPTNATNPSMTAVNIPSDSFMPTKDSKVYHLVKIGDEFLFDDAVGVNEDRDFDDGDFHDNDINDDDDDEDDDDDDEDDDDDDENGNYGGNQRRRQQQRSQRRRQQRRRQKRRRRGAPATSTTTASAAASSSSIYRNRLRIANFRSHSRIVDRFALGGSKSNYKLGAAGKVRKAIPEMFLTRLLSTKGTLQKFIDDFLTTILTVNEFLPISIKWLFDLFDDAARKYNITNPEVVHSWKSNSLQLRFWVNFIKNPDFIFDVNKTITLDSNLSVIAEFFMDSCSLASHRLGKDSPTNKLLFAKDVPHYRQKVMNFYNEIAKLPKVSDAKLNVAMNQISQQQQPQQQHIKDFDSIAALKELYIYVIDYRDHILEALENDMSCRKASLALKLEQVSYILEGENISIC